MSDWYGAIQAREIAPAFRPGRVTLDEFMAKRQLDAYAGVTQSQCKLFSPMSMSNEFFSEAPGVPPPIGHSALAVKAGPHVDSAMMLGRTPDGTLVPGGIQAETAQTLRNTRTLLHRVDPDMGLGDLNRTTVFLRSLGYFQAMNEVYRDNQFFGDERRQPVRAIIQSKLPMGASVGVIAQSHHVGEKNKKRFRELPGVPPPIGPYNRVVVSGNNHIDLAATGPFTADGARLGTIEEETNLIFDNLEAALNGVREKLGLNSLTLGDIYRMTVCLQDLSDFDRMNEIYQQRYSGKQLPVRATLQQPQIIGGAKVQMIAEALNPESLRTRAISEAKGAPKAIGPYSLAAQFGPHVEFAGSLPCDEQLNLVPGGVDAQMHRVLDNIAAIAHAVRDDLSLSNVLRLAIALTNLRDMDEANGVLRERFPQNRPVVSFLHSPTLPKGALVEAIASMHEEEPKAAA